MMKIKEVDQPCTAVLLMVVSYFDDNFLSLLNASLETRLEAIPGLLHDLFDRLSQQDILPFKPDYCVIDVFNEVI